MATNEDVIELEPWDIEGLQEDESWAVQRWIRITLTVLTIPWLAVFAVALVLIDPNVGGEPARMGTHKQLGLTECAFKEITCVPCPSCGMTTSFAFLVRGDVWHSMLANFAGTALAIFGLFFIPWALASAFLGRFVFVRRLEVAVFRLAIWFLILLFGRWMFVVIWELLTPPGILD